MLTIKKNKHLRLVMLLYGLNILINLNCMPLDIAYRAVESPVSIQSDIVDLKKPLSGRVGFCSIFDFYYEENINSGLSLENLDNVQKIFIEMIPFKNIIVCQYDNISKDFNAWKYGPKYPYFLKEYKFTSAKGYARVFDEKDEAGVWRMYPNSLEFFNKYFKCDYYLTGKVDLSSVSDSNIKNFISFRSNILMVKLFLVLYDNKGYKVWSKLYQKQYESKDKNQKLDDLYYIYIKQLLNDCKSEINNDLSVEV